MFRLTRSLVFFCRAAALAIGLIASAASATPADSPRGTWSTANGHGVIAIEPCGDALCGRIVGIDRNPTEPMPTDVHGRPQCGLTIITNEKPETDGTWLGNVTDPRDGSVEFREMLLQCGAMVGPEFENGDAPDGEVLLIAEVLVRHDEHFESRLFCRVE